MHEAIANPQTPQSTIHEQFIALQGEETQIHLPLHRHKFHKALNLDKSLDPSHPQRTVSTTKWSHKPPACKKRDPNHSNRDRMKWERNMQLVKITDKNPQKQTKED